MNKIIKTAPEEIAEKAAVGATSTSRTYWLITWPFLTPGPTAAKIGPTEVSL